MVARCVESFKHISDRVMSIRIRGKSLNATIIQLHAPTADAPEQDVEQCYALARKARDQAAKKDMVFVVGDLDAKAGEGEDVGVVGKHGLGDRNDSGDRLVRFCQESRLGIAHIFFTQPKRRLHTWTSPGGQYRNQIDYILCQQQWKNSILAAKTLPGADCGSDHQLLIAKVRVRLCKAKRPTAQRKLDVGKIPIHSTRSK